MRQVDAPLYFPFELGDKRPIRPTQGYLFKLPRFFVNIFSELAIESPEVPLIPIKRPDRPGDEYRRADEDASVGGFDPLQVDPAVVERGTRGHAITQNALADYIISRGVSPRSARPNEPGFDIAWMWEGALYIGEVKSVTNRNEQSQLRLGLGQLLQYRHQMRIVYPGKVVAVLATERKPPQLWIDICNALEIELVWPGAFDRLRM
jgi:hypothetical protein